MHETHKKSNNNNKKKIYDELFIRRKKLKKIQKKGNAFPNNFRKDIISDKIHKMHGEKSKQKLKKIKIIVNVAGRIMSKRTIGKSSFITLQDMGGKIQLYITSKDISENFYKKIFKTWDIGDIIGANGILFKTNTGELSVRCYKILLLTKAIRPLPDKFHGLNNREIKYRKRYLDLITNKNTRKIFKIRSRVILEIRNYMTKNNFIEVETPIMQNIPGGATANPFNTYHNALKANMYLRISPELYLKQLVIGGFEKIFEINKNFRNEGLSPYHNPEFTMMELYIAYEDYRGLIVLIENLFQILTKKILGTNIIKYKNYVFNFNKPFCKMTMKEAICHFNKNIIPKELDNIVKINHIANSLKIKIEKEWGLGKIQTKIFENITKNHLIQPTIITHYPEEVSPLARKNDKNPFFTDRFELFIGGFEIGNGFSELNDSEDQKIRFKKKQKKNNLHNKKNIPYDKNYITALEYGLPPTAGLGIGIDRLIMLFTNTKNIRDVILFPLLKPNK
ncbi:MAG: lysine--tRNA ligase/Ap4A synthetase/Ap3A synthetase [Candidatus Westeberhardia cardiocondylae]|nr:lysine--tRNA ligase/Ap4A synthetase/Ap3A synthetase [Candidatus Westeberhardia cardiocondylae]